MKRDGIVSRIRKHADAIRAQSATALYLFGSIARNEADARERYDVFVDYDPNGRFSLLNILAKVG